MSAQRVLTSIGVLVLSGGVGLAAQQQSAQVPPSQSDVEVQLTAQLKVQVRNFEAVLRAAVEDGGRRLQLRAKQVLSVAPELRLASQPAVLGAPLPDGSVVFTVEVPDLMATGLNLFSMMIEREKNMNRPVATAPDRPAPEAGGEVPVIPPFDPTKEYSDFVRESLIDAMIENSQALRLADSVDLVVIASVTQGVRRNPLDTSRLLILSVKGEHLTAYRQNRLTKDEVKQRIVDRRF
jgi:hypothetical protein